MSLSAGQILHASDLFDCFVGDVTNNASARNTTGTEAIGNTVTFTSAGTSARYKFTWTGSHQSTVALDVSRLRLRYQSGASLTAAGTQLRIQTAKAEVANSSEPFCLVGTVTGLAAGQWTAGGTIIRVVGTGTMSVNGNSTDEEYFLVERIA